MLKPVRMLFIGIVYFLSFLYQPVKSLVYKRSIVPAFNLKSIQWSRPCSLLTVVDSSKTASISSISSSHSNVGSSYGAESITVLKGLEPVRKRPGMYIGSTGSSGLHHLVFEVVDNCVDEALAGYCNNITLTLRSDGAIEVEDNGRGIPCDIHPSTGKSSLETVLCVLHAGGKFGGEHSGYKVSGGLHGVGLSVVNALSESLKVQVTRNGKVHVMGFERGIPTTALEERPIASEDENMKTSGTKVTFVPDQVIFKSGIEFEFDKLAGRMDELAYLNAGLTIRMIDERKTTPIKTVSISSGISSDDDDVLDKEFTPIVALAVKSSVIVSGDSSNSSSSNSTITPAPQRKMKVFRHDGGIAELVSTMCKSKTSLFTPDVKTSVNLPQSGTVSVRILSDSENSGGDVIYIEGTKNNVSVEVALRWSSDMYTDHLVSFANGIRTIDGGTHLDGMKSSVSKSVAAYIRKTSKNKDVPPIIPGGEFIREGLTAIVSVKVPESEFEGQTKTRLGNPEVRQIVDSIVCDALSTLFEWTPGLPAAITKKAQEAQAAALAAKAARDMVRRKSLLHSTVLPGKLADCSSRKPSECELYLVEGDSAAGSAKQGRDRNTQAILPLKGKILNIERASNDKIYQNAELQGIISALGLGMRGDNFDINTLRYGKVIIMTDADVDGAHIRLLLLTFLYRYRKELFSSGSVYIACPPLYKVTSSNGSRSRGKIEKYLYDQESMDDYMMKNFGTINKEQLSVEDTADTDDASFSQSPSATPAVSIQRFKGLGEMMPQQLWETTMDPKGRTLKLVTVEDAAAADRMFGVLMGDDVVPRKKFIIDHAGSMSISDFDY